MEEPEEAYDYDDDYGDYEAADGPTSFAALAQEQAVRAIRPYKSLI